MESPYSSATNFRTYTNSQLGLTIRLFETIPIPLRPSNSLGLNCCLFPIEILILICFRNSVSPDLNRTLRRSMTVICFNFEKN